MPGANYLDLDDVIAIHRDIMALMGSPYTPLLHPDKLDSALNRPRQLAFYEPGADLITQAVLLAVGISQAQAFQDGNKRVGFLATDAFLAINGVRFEGDPVTFACWLICAAGSINDEDLDVVAGHLGLDRAAELDAMDRESVGRRFEDWLRANSSGRDPAAILAGDP